MKNVLLILVALCILMSFTTPDILMANRDIHFVDITDSAGVGDVSLSPASAMADFDNNGRIDIYLCIKNFPNKLYWNIDGTHFQDVARRAHVDDSSTSMDCVFADINNDGWLDLFVSNEFDSSRVYLNTGNGTYDDITVSAGIYTQGYAHSPTFADIDRDGDLDLYLTNAYNYNWMFINNGNNTFTDSTFWCGTPGRGESFGCFFSDINNDSISDLYVVSRGSLPNVMYMGLGNGQFADTTFWSGTQCENSAGQSSLLFDYDNDGDLDLYVANGGYDPDSLYNNNGNGQFVNVTEHANIYDYSYGRSATSSDFNNDGFQDIIVLNAEGEIAVYQNNGDGTFSNVAATSGLVYQEYPAGCSAGDIDNDGDLDLYITNIAGTNRLYRNLCNDINFLKIKLVGTVSNRFGIGSKIQLFNESDSLIGYREMAIGKARLSMNPPIAHFGVQYGSLYKLSVTFPSGIVVDSTNIEAGQTITIYEESSGIKTSDTKQKQTPELYCMNTNLTPPYLFKLTLSEKEKIKSAVVYDARGRKIKDLSIKNSNSSEIILKWDGKYDNKEKVFCGIYFLKVQILGIKGISTSLSGKIIFLK